MLLTWWHSYLWQSSWQTASKQTSEIWVQAQNMTPWLNKNRVPPYTFASCWDGNWSFEALFAQRHSSQAIHNIGCANSHINAQKVCSNILARGFSLNVKTLQIRDSNFWSDQKIHLISFFHTSCIKSTRQIVQIHF